MNNNTSIMSYNVAHWTRGLDSPDTPGRFIPEDLRGLAWDRRVFPNLRFRADIDVPAGYAIAKPVCLGPWLIPGQPDYAPAVTTASGEDYGTKVTNIVGSQIDPNIAPQDVDRGGTNFNPGTMWCSCPLWPTGGRRSLSPSPPR